VEFSKREMVSLRLDGDYLLSQYAISLLPCISLLIWLNKTSFSEFSNVDQFCEHVANSNMEYGSGVCVVDINIT